MVLFSYMLTNHHHIFHDMHDHPAMHDVLIILQNMKDSKDQVIGEQNIVSMFYASILLL